MLITARRFFFLPLLIAATVLTPSLASARPRSLPAIAQRYEQVVAFDYDHIRAIVPDMDMEARFTFDGKGILFRRGAVGARTLFYRDFATQKEKAIVSDADLSAALGKATGRDVPSRMLVLTDPDYDSAADTLGFTALGSRWRLNADRSVTLIDDGKAQRFAGRPSPDGRYIIVQRGPNIALADKTSGREIPLTGDGGPDLLYGQSLATLGDKLAAKRDDIEGPLRVQWSPDGRWLLFSKADLRGVRRLPVVEHTPRDTIYPRGYSVVYPMAGDDPLPSVTFMVADIAATLAEGHAETKALDIPAQSMLDQRLPHIWWQGDHVRVVWTERGYARQRVYLADPASGKAKVIVEEQGIPAITVTATRIWPAPSMGGEFVISERSGWAQLYLVTPDDPKGGKPLTSGDWEVLSAQIAEAEDGGILVTGIGREPDRPPYARQLYRIGRDGGSPQLLTPEPLDHETLISLDGRWILDAMSSPSVPTSTVLRDARDGHIVLMLGRADPARLIQAGYVMPQPFEGLAADGKTKLAGMIFRPAGFDPGRRYPVIDALYTGPTTHSVPVSWNDAVLASASQFAQIGAVAVIIDGRGTSGRGKAFRMDAWHDLGEVGIDDHLAMIDQMAARYPAIDANHIGVVGGSAGGYDAARFLLRRPDRISVAIASSGNHELRLDKTWWPEVMMGGADKAAWDANSNIPLASGKRGKLLLIHGEMDDNVPVAASLRLADAIIRTGHDVDMMIVPNARHHLPWPFYRRKVLDYFTLNLLREVPPLDETSF